MTDHSYFAGINFDTLYLLPQGPISLNLIDKTDTSYFNYYEDFPEAVPGFGCTQYQDYEDEDVVDAKGYASSRASGDNTRSSDSNDFSKFSFNNLPLR